MIVEYLDNVAPNSKLMPQPNREHIEAKRWEALADGMLDAAVAVRRESLRPQKEQNVETIERNQAAIVRCIAFMANSLGDGAWCISNHFGLADIAVGCALGYLDLHFPDLDWRGAHPNLGKLYDKLMQRPSFVDTAPPSA